MFIVIEKTLVVIFSPSTRQSIIPSREHFQKPVIRMSPAPVNDGAANTCSITLPPLPSGDICTAPVPDCFGKAYPQLGSSIYRDSVGTSEDAFAMRYNESFFHNNISSTPKNKGGGRRCKKSRNTRIRRKARVRGTSIRSGSRRIRTRSRTRAQSRRRRGGGYYLDLSSCPPGGLPSTIGYNDLTPPYFGNKAIAKGTPCQPRTYTRDNVGYCDQTLK